MLMDNIKERPRQCQHKASLCGKFAFKHALVASHRTQSQVNQHNMCVCHRWSCRHCSAGRDEVLACSVAHQRRVYCEIIQELPTSQLAPGRPLICRQCGSAQDPAHLTLSQQSATAQRGNPLQVRHGIDLEETLQKYNEVRGQVFVRTEKKMSERKREEAKKGGENDDGETKETVFEKAWRQLRADIERK